MKKTLWSFVAALLVLGAVYWAMTAREKSRARSGYAFGDLRPEDVTRLRVDYLGDSVTLIRSSQGWLTEVDSFPADTPRVARVLGYLLGLQDKEQIAGHGGEGHGPGTGDGGNREEREARLTEFGLDSASARHVALTLADGRTVRVLLGKISGLDYGSVFWKPADKADGGGVYRTPGKFVYEVSSRAMDWKDTNLFVPFAGRDIRSVTVEWTTPEGLIHFYSLLRDSTRGDTAFLIKEPFDAPAARTPAANIFRHAAQFKVDEFVAGFDSSAARAGLDNPVMTVRVLLKNGVENVVVAGNPVDGLYRYVKHPWHKDPVRVFLWRFEYFNKTAESFVEGEN